MAHRARRQPARRLCQAGLAASSLMLAVPAAMAQAVSPPASPASGAGVLETVTVTAERRAENIKDVPMSIATVKGEKLDVLTSGGQDIRFLSGRSPSVATSSG